MDDPFSLISSRVGYNTKEIFAYSSVIAFDSDAHNSLATPLYIIHIYLGQDFLSCRLRHLLPHEVNRYTSTLYYCHL